MRVSHLRGDSSRGPHAHHDSRDHTWHERPSPAFRSCCVHPNADTSACGPRRRCFSSWRASTRPAPSSWTRSTRSWGRGAQRVSHRHPNRTGKGRCAFFKGQGQPHVLPCSCLRGTLVSYCNMLPWFVTLPSHPRVRAPLPASPAGEHEASRRMKTELLIQLDGLARRSDELVFVLVRAVGVAGRPKLVRAVGWLMRWAQAHTPSGLPLILELISPLTGRLPPTCPGSWMR